VARREWGGAQPESQPYFVRVWHPGDANSYVELRRSYAREVTMNVDQMFFDAASGEVLHRFQAAPVMSAQRFISGIHFIQFEHWTLRWLYFLAGLAGCVLIATGFLFWLEARRARHAAKGLAGVRAVEGLTVGSVTGIVIAMLAFLAANRLLPDGQQRAALEVWTFYLAWLASFAHAWWRGKAAWREQAWTACLLAVACVLLNAATTGDHVARALADGKWSVAGVDLMLLALALLAAWSARRLAGKPAQARVPGAEARS
ncbi:MAG TPA: PepSY domain-containing protein, partial [Massilia timonae]|nr:PepSY domain-containing protein [Massilia timonae]